MSHHAGSVAAAIGGSIGGLICALLLRRLGFHLGAHDGVVYDGPLESRCTSSGTVYRASLSDFGDERYHLGEFCAGFTQELDGVDLRFVSGRAERAGLAVFADAWSLHDHLLAHDDIGLALKASEPGRK